MSTRRRKLIFAFCIAFLIILASLCSIIIYYYTHPAAVKSSLEKSIGRATGTSVTIETLSYSAKPLVIQIKGIAAEPLEPPAGFHLRIPMLTAEMALEGPFGNRSLVVRNLRIDGFSMRVSGQMNLPGFPRPAGEDSVLGGLLKKLAAVLLFREFRFEAVAVAEASITAESREQIVKLSGLQATFNPDRLIEISCRADIERPLDQVRFIAPKLQISTDSVISVADPEIPFLLSITDAMFQIPQAQALGMGIRGRLNYRHDSKELIFAPADLAFEELTLSHQSGSESIPVSLHLSTAGWFDLKEYRLHPSGFHLTMSDAVDLRGTFQAQITPQAKVTLELGDGNVFPQNLLRLLGDKVVEGLGLVSLTGAVALHGRVNGLREQNRWSWHCDLQGRLAKNFLSYHMNEMRLGAKISGQIGAEGTLPRLRMSLTITSDESSLSGKNVEIPPFKAGLSLSGEYPVFQIDEMSADVPRAQVTWGKRRIAIDDIRVSGRRGRLLAEKKALFLPEVRLSSSLIKNLLLSLKADGNQLEIGVQGEKTNLIGSASALNLVPTGWQVAGLDTIRMRAVRQDQGDVSFAGKLGFSEVRFQNEDGSSLGEEIAIDTAVEGTYRSRTSSITAKGSLEVNGGEVLIGPFYGDLKKNGFFSQVGGRYDIPGRFLELTSLRLGLKDIVALNIRGSFLHKNQTRHLNLKLDIPKTVVSPLFKQFLVEPFKTTTPSLATLSTGGVVSANMDLKSTGDQWLAAGHLRWQGGRLSTENQPLSLEGIDLDLPVWYLSGSGEGNGNPMEGSLSVQSMALPFVQEQPLALKLEAEPNRLSVKSPTTLLIPGGEVRIGPLTGKDIFGARPTFETSLALDDLDIKPLLGRIGSQTPEAEISGRLAPVVLQGHSISSEGELRVNVFNGKITLSHLGVSGLFTPAPLVELSTELKDLNLGEMSSGTSFGKIEGVLQGHVHELEIANGQPQNFDLLLETVKTRGIPQMISVKAVDNIAKIGGAQSPFMGFAKVFSSFLKHFPYRKIGVHATVKNDIFRINGTIKEGDTEYLVRRGTLWGVDVINQSTDNRTSFKDMVKRIKRVTEGSKGPVVK